MRLAAALALLSVLLFGPAGMLLDGRPWASRAPRSAIVLWQSVGLAGGVAAIGAGLALAVAPFHLGLLGGLARLAAQSRAGYPLRGLGLDGAVGLTLAVDVSLVLAGGLLVAAVRTLRLRTRHRRLLDLVSNRSERAPGVVLLDRPEAAAYCLPGWHPRIVLSAGTLGLLGPTELDAVLAHEQGHVHERHDLVLLPFASMCQLLRWMPYVRRAPKAVGTLVEMAADDFATRTHEPRALASALVHLVSANAPPTSALAAAQSSVTTRVHRLLRPERTSPWVAVACTLSAGVVVAVPLLALAVPSALS